MKRIGLLCIALFAAAQPFFMTGTAAADTLKPQLNERTLELLQTNLLHSFQQPSKDIQAGAAQIVIDLQRRYPELDLSFAEIPLLSMMRNSEQPELRIIAGLALYSLHTETARYAIQRRALYDNSERVAKLLGKFSRFWNDQPDSPVKALAKNDQLAFGAF